MENDLMEQWDYWRARIAGGDAGSAPRDWFESVVDWLTEKAEDWREKYIICCEDSKLNMEAMKQRAERAEARIRELEAALALNLGVAENDPMITEDPLANAVQNEFRDRAERAEAKLRELAEAVSEIDLFFQSGNNIPVEKATITQEQWQSVQAALEVAKVG